MSRKELNGWTEAKVTGEKATITQEVMVNKEQTVNLSKSDLEALLEEMN